MQTKNFTLSVIFLLLFLTACEYKPEGAFLRVVNPDNEFPDITFNTSLDQDTNTVAWSGSIHFNWQIHNKELLGIRLFINDHEVETDYNWGSSFGIALTKGLVDGFTVDGFYRVRFELITNSGTGSIADLAGGEGYIFSFECVMMMIENIETPQLESVQLKNGRIELNWSKYPGMHFESYILEKQNVNLPYIIETTIANIDDRDLLTITDQTYVGEPARFYLMTKVSGDYLTSDTIVWPKNIPQIQLEQVNDGHTFNYSWNKTEYYENFGGYKLSVQDDNSGSTFGYAYLTTLSNVNDTTYTVDLVKIGETLDMLLTIVPASSHPIYEDYNTQLSHFSTNVFGRIGQEFPEYHLASVPFGPGIFFKSYDETRINTYNPENGTFDTFESPDYDHIYFSVSANSKWLISSTSSDNFELINLETNNQELIPYTLLECTNPVLSLSISDNGFAALRSGNKIAVWDIENKIKHAETSWNFLRNLIISPDGAFLIADNSAGYKLFKIEDGELSPVLSYEFLSEEIAFLDFFPDDPEKICIGTTQNIYIANRESLEVLSSIPVELDYYMNIDFTSNGVLVKTTENYLRAYDLNTGEIRWEKPVIENPGIIRLFHNTIFAGEGYYLSID